MDRAIRLTAKAQRQYEKLSVALRRELARVFAAIGADPEAHTRHFTHGARFYDGCILAGGKTYYFQVLFGLSTNDRAIDILLIPPPMESTGPH